MSKAVHQKNFYKAAEDPTRCDFALNNSPRDVHIDPSPVVRLESSPSLGDILGDNEDSALNNSPRAVDGDILGDNEDSTPFCVPVIRTPIQRTPLHELVLRPPETKD